LGLFVREFGANQPSSIVFLHGGGLSGWMWERQVKALSDFHCLVPDLPEQGKSKEFKPFSIKNSAQQISELIKNKAHGGKAHVVGHSLGAQIVVQLLSMSPEVVDRAIVNSALLRRIPILNGLIRPTVRLTLPLTKVKWFAKIQAKYLSVPAADFSKYYYDSKSLTDELLEKLLRENMNFSIPEGLEYCTVPTLILAGQKERGIMRNSAKDLVSVMPNSQGYLVQGVGHSFNFAAPQLFNKILRTWLSKQELPPTERLRAI